MKIIILGANGNLGSAISKKLRLNDEYDVIAWDRDDIDITDKELVEKKLGEIKPEVIINCAAYNAMDKCEENDDEFALAKKLNSDAVGYLAEAALETNALIVYFSTDYVFDGNKIEGYKEDEEPNPISRYAETKWMGEQEIIRRSGKGLRWYLIRTSKLFGEKGTGVNSKLSFFDLILNLSHERDHFDMVQKEEISCFTYIPDLADAVLGLIEGQASNGIYHITNSGPASWYDGAVELFKLKPNNKIKINPVPTSDKYPRPAKRPKNSVLINTKLPPLRNWKEALREYLTS
jgi:dTDP-4-dehydrorhamnose reductase